MKKMLAATVGAVLMTSGLVAATATTAHADPYPGTIATATAVTTPGKVRLRKKVNVCVSVTATGNASPSGALVITVTRNKGGFSQTSTVPYNGSSVCVRTKKLRKKGRYTATATYSAPAQSVYKGSAGSSGFKVKKRRR